MKITLEALETLVAIDEEGSFAAAARRLHKVQSAVSYGVRQLEESLGLEIFDRSGHRALLTSAGTALLEEGRILLERAAHLERVAGAWKEGWEPRLSVVVDSVLPLHPVLAAVQQLDLDGAPTRIEVQMATLGGVQRRFQDSDADLMIVKEFVPGPGLAARGLAPVHMVLVAAKHHALAQCEVVADEALKSHRELLVYDSGAPRPTPSSHAVGGSLRFFLGDFGAKRQAMHAGLGYGWLPEAMIEDELADGSLVRLAWDGGARFAFTPQLVQRVDRPLGKAGQRFAELVVRSSLLPTRTAVA
mgnify:CR=1 FL=1